MRSIAVLGTKNGEMAMAGLLAMMGHKANLFNRGEERLWGVKDSGAIEFKQVLTGKNILAEVIISEAQTFIFASQATGPSQGHIFRIKHPIPVASIRTHLIPKVINKLHKFYSIITVLN